MEIHRPKPWSNLRELAKEVGVIAIGIAIALGGEQTLEWLHRRTEVSEAREALRSEIAENASVALFSLEEDRCRGGALDGFQAWANGGQPPPVSARRGFHLLATNVWETVKIGAVAHMPLRERLAYSRFYDRVEIMKGLTQGEAAAFLRLVPYRTKAALTPADAAGLEGEVGQARVFLSNRALASASLLQASKALGVEPNPLSPQDRQVLSDMCRGLNVLPVASP